LASIFSIGVSLIAIAIGHSIGKPIGRVLSQSPAQAIERAIPAEVLAEELIVGSCPTPITVQRKGIWATAEPNEQARAEMAANPERKASVAAVFTRADSAFFVVTGLGSLQKAQGRLSQRDFAQIKEEVAKGWSTGIKGVKGAQGVMDNLAKSGGYTVSQYSIDSMASPDRDRFYTTGISSGVSRDGPKFHSIAVGIMQLVHGCIVNVNIALPIPPYKATDVEEAVANLVLR
jgi:hypothetical protein